MRRIDGEVVDHELVRDDVGAGESQDLSAGSLYAAKWNQLSAANGGKATLTWIKLGSATNAQIKAAVDARRLNGLSNADADRIIASVDQKRTRYSEAMR